MPNPAGDIEINGLPYMLARSPDAPGRRLWRSFAISTQTTRRTEVDAKYGVAAPEIQYPFAWEDLSEGYGDSEFIRPGGYLYAVNHDASRKHQVVPGPGDTTIVLNASLAGLNATYNTGPVVEYQSNLHSFLGYRGFRISPAEVVTELAAFGSATWVENAVVFGTYMYLSVWGSGYVQNAFYQMNTGGTFTQATTSLPATHFVVEKERLWRGFIGTASGRTDEQAWVVSNVAMGSDPMAFANWSANYAVGESSAPITRMARHDGILLVAKADGLYFYDDTENRFENVLPFVAIAPDRQNGICLYSWNGLIFYNTQDALYALRFEGNTVYPQRYNITPGYNRSNDSPIAGTVIALTNAGDMLYAILDDRGTSGVRNYWLLKGRLNEGQSNKELIIWDSLRQIGSERIISLVESGLVTRRRLYWTPRRTALPSRIYWIPLPPGDGNPLQDIDYIWQSEYAAGNPSFYLPHHDAGAPTTLKAWRSISAEVDPITFVTSGNAGSVQLWYRIDTATWASLGWITNANDPVATFRLPDSNSSGYRIQLGFTVTRLNASLSPVLKKIWGLATARPENMRGYEAYIRLANTLRLPNGGYDPRDAAQVSTDLYGLRATGPVNLVTPLGDSRNVLILNSIEEQEVSQYNIDNPEMVAKVTMIDWS